MSLAVLKKTTEFFVSQQSSGISEQPQSSNDSDSEESQDETPKSNIPLPARVKELRSRFVCSEFTSKRFKNKILIAFNFCMLMYLGHRIRKKELRSSRKRLSLDNRHSLAIYTSRNMDGYTDGDSDDEVYMPRCVYSYIE